MHLNKKINELAAHILGSTLENEFKAIIANIEIDEGFLIDFKLTDSNISTNDFNKLERLMGKIVSGANLIENLNIKSDGTPSELSQNPYAQHKISKDGATSYVKFGKYVGLSNEILDFKSTNVVKNYKLLSVGGSYWLGDAKNEQLIRLRGFASDNKEEYEEYLKYYNDRLERDHRTVGKNLELFTFNSLGGQGMPFWLPNGTVIRKEIRNFISELEFKYGFESVCTPVLGSVELYKQSGHWDHYQENMFPVINIENEELVLRPMTCPHHILIYKNKPRSYRQLPLRICEESILHRYESSGGLTGFERVREMTLEDVHIFCTTEQLENEVLNCYNIIKDAHAGLNNQIFQIDLSLHDPKDAEKFHHDNEMWVKAEQSLRNMLDKHKIPYVEKVGEAAFYGPKIDFQVKTVLNRIITISTIQLDFLLPEKFDLSYKDKNGEQKQTVMVHLGIIGTYERLLSIILEQTKGVLPLWLSPNQVTIIPVNNDIHLEYCEKIEKELRSKMIRCNVDNRDERLSKKIREAQISKIPYQIVIGDDELKSNNIAYRKYGEENTTTSNLSDFAKLLSSEITNKK
ncbi:MAG: threonine--tRNA ligase [Mycoplasma sp.]